jgi:hypothetical protein
MFPLRIDAQRNGAGLVVLRLILVDESKRKDYILCAVEIDMALTSATRVAVSRLMLKGKRSKGAKEHSLCVRERFSTQEHFGCFCKN